MGSSEAENGDPTYSSIENISSSNTKKFPRQSLHIYQVKNLIFNHVCCEMKLNSDGAS